MRRFFINQPAGPGAVVVIENPDANHIVNVLRMQPGDEIWLFDGADHEFRAHVSGISDGTVTVEVTESFSCLNDSPVRITVGQSLLKNKKTDTVLRQLTELGIDGWIPLQTERSVIKIDRQNEPSKTDRWQTIVKESVKQCQRGRIPKIYPAAEFSEALVLRRRHDLNILFSDGAGDALHLIRERVRHTAPVSILLLLGPEGGFSPREIELARENEFFCAGLGPRILKADTAAVAACAIVQALFGDMGKKDSPR
ncbi:MAG: 16S rRNA (uracil(1498)-N(3))-methyltransferase [Thermodesulfobacteriota bacterium]